MSDVCNDDRFEKIELIKQALIENTNISTSPEEMNVIDNILFRFWQLGWIDAILSRVLSTIPTSIPEIPDSLLVINKITSLDKYNSRR